MANSASIQIEELNLRLKLLETQVHYIYSAVTILAPYIIKAGSDRCLTDVEASLQFDKAYSVLQKLMTEDNSELRSSQPGK